MGITIFAEGRLDRLEDVPLVVEELKALAIRHGWRYTLIDDDFDEVSKATLIRDGSTATINGSLGLKGIVLSVSPKSERLEIVFNRNGELTNIMQQLSGQSEPQTSHFTVCKTQFAGADCHTQIIEILDLLKERYLSNLTVKDEGGYWGSRNRAELAEKFAVLQHYLDEGERIVRSIKVTEGEVDDPEKFAAVVERAFLAEGKNRVVH